MRHICDNCGFNYKGDGLAIDMSVTAHWNEKKNRYEFKKSFIDVEMKCPNCYGFVDDIAFYTEE